MTFPLNGFMCEAVLHLETHRPSYYCGYVIIPRVLEDHIRGLCNANVSFREYIEANINCHGGITYCQDTGGGCVKVGFDCAHVNDTIETCNEEFVLNEILLITQQLDDLTDESF